MVKTRTKTSSSGRSVSAADENLLYGLYKQATVGDAPKRSLSMKFGKKSKGKEKAWKKLQDIPEETLEEALRHVSKALEILQTSEKGAASVDLLRKVGAVEPEQIIAKNNSEDRSASECAETEDDTTDVSPEDKLLVAAAEDDVDLLKSLLEKGVSCGHRDDCGQTAMHLAADNGSERCLQVLLDHGADVDSSDQHGVSVLQAAVIAGHVNICKILLDRGADPDHKDEDGDSPYTCAMDDGSPQLQALFEEEEEDEHMEQESTISWDTEFTMQKQDAGVKIIDRTPTSLLDS